jgi:hypothetical protein
MKAFIAKKNQSNLSKFLGLLLILLSSNVLLAQTSWTGTIDTDWNKSGNWTAGIPDATDDVIIPNVTTNDPVILTGTVAEATSVNVATSANLTIDAGGTLKINGSAANGMDILGNVDNSGQIIIGMNQIIGAKGIYIDNGTLTNQTGAVIQVEETVSYGIHFYYGTFTNSGTIILGANKKVGSHGIFNERALTNNIDGLIQIEETGGSGIYSTPWFVHFTNAGIITIGVNKKVSGHGIYNKENFTNAAGATIQIEETGGSGINNVETFGRWFSNAGTITIGLNKKTGQSGIRNYYSQFSNSGTIQIDETGGDGIYNDNTFNNSSTITLGVNKKVGGIGFNNDGNTFNNSGTLQIEETGSHGVHNDWAAKFNNSGLVTIGVNKKVGGVGYSTFYGYLNNYAGATIQIEETGSHGYYSDTGIATNNHGTITIGVNKKVGGTGIYNDVCGNSPFTNHSDGVIQIEETAVHGIFNTDCAVMNNEGIITIGANKPVGFYGIYNYDEAKFNNNGGEITIDRTPQEALVNKYRYVYSKPTFTNQATITIGGLDNVGSNGITNNGIFKNNAGGEIDIDQTTSGAILNQTGGTFTNLADITIGASTPVGEYGIENQASFSNNGGEINIDQSTSSGIHNVSGTFSNSAAITIGANASAGYYGVWNKATFNNNTGGVINMDNSISHVLYNTAGTFVNEATIIIGALGPLGAQYGVINNGATFYNNSGADIHVDNTSNGIGNFSGGTFTNEANINIGGLATIQEGLRNQSTFYNNAGGNINIDKVTGQGIFSSTFFENEAVITIGATAGTGYYGIYCQQTFNNNPGGVINIDHTVLRGLLNAGTFSNKATINIGATGPLGEAGLYNQRNFYNEAGGVININNPGGFGIWNRSNATTFRNLSCAEIYTLSPIKNENSIINNGFFVVNTSDSHINTGSLTNNGVLIYPQGNPIPNVINNDLIVSPIAGDCTIADALQIGGANDFTMSNNWYTDLGLSDVAGDYNSNTFNVTNLSEGTHTLYFTAIGNGCSFTPSIQVDYDDVTPPAPVCKTGIVELGTDGNYALTENDVLDGGTDDCGSLQFISMSITSVNCSEVNSDVSVIVNTTDGNGNDNSCIATITVVDNIPPVISCPANITEDVDAGICCASLTIAAPSITDNCGTITLTNDYNETDDASDIYFPGETIIVWTAIDGTGNTATCEQIVIVEDNEAPMLAYTTGICQTTYEECLSEQELYLIEQELIYEEMISNCNGDLNCLKEAEKFGAAINEDARKNMARCIYDFNNCENEVIPVENNTMPPIVVEATIGSCEIELNPGPVVIENCAEFTLSNNFNSNGSGEGMYPVGTTIVLWTATDQYGNVSTVSRSITVLDAENPTIECPLDATVNCQDETSSSSTGMATGSDVCGNTTIEESSVSDQNMDINSPGYFNYTITRTWTATDESGNQSSCDQIITVQDVTSPDVVCQNLITVLDEFGLASISEDAVDNGSSDICSSVSFNTDITAFDCSDVGDNTVVLTVTDITGNSSTCEATVTVQDNELPVITNCPSNQELCGSQVVTWEEPSASDNCLVSFTSDFNSGDVFPVGTTTVTYTAVDAGNNIVTCSFEIWIHSLPEINITGSNVPDFCQGVTVLDVNVTNTQDLLEPLVYEWSNGLGDETSVLIQSNGVYSVTVTDDYGCETSTSVTVDVEQSDNLSGYTLLASKEIKLKESTVSGGGVGVMNAGKKAKIEKNSVVNTFVKADDIDIKSGSTVATEIYAQANVTLPTFIYNTLGDGDDIDVEEDQTVTLTGDHYGKIEVEEGGTLIFDNPNIYIEELKTKDEATIEFTQTTNLIIEKKVDLKKDNNFNLSNEIVTLYVEDDFDIEEGGEFFGNVYAEKKIKAKGKDDNPTNMTGQFITLDKIDSEDYIHWNWGGGCDLYPPVQARNSNPGTSVVVSQFEDTSLSVYPNPASYELKVDLNGVNQDKTLTILDQIGKVIWTKDLSADQNQITIPLADNNFASGVYFIQTNVNGKLLNQRFIIVK